MKQVAARLRLDMAAFRELAAFAQFGSDLDKSTQAQLNRGLHLQEILKQTQYAPMRLEHQVIVIFAGTRGYADQVPLDHMRRWETDLIRFMDTSYPEIGKEVAEQKRITEANEARLRDAITAFNSAWV
jgi:F-type H+-transporting ATPase subunit alpha